MPLSIIFYPKLAVFFNNQFLRIGLQVQERSAGGMKRLQAGGSLRSYLEVWTEPDGTRRIHKFDQQAWFRRFAPLVEPTAEIAEYLYDCSAAFGGLPPDAGSALKSAIAHFESTGEWSDLPKLDESRSAYDEAIRLKPQDADAYT